MGESFFYKKKQPADALTAGPYVVARRLFAYGPTGAWCGPRRKKMAGQAGFDW